MHEYDTVLKALLESAQNTILEQITGVRIDHWLNVEFPEVRQTRVDMLGETADHRRIIGLEFQSTNDARLPLRMVEYALLSVFTGCMDGFQSNMRFMWVMRKCECRKN